MSEKETMDDLRWFFSNNYGPHANKKARQIIDRLERTEAQHDQLLAIAEKIAKWSDWTETCLSLGDGTLTQFAEEIVPELFAAIAAAKETTHV